MLVQVIHSRIEERANLIVGGPYLRYLRIELEALLVVVALNVDVSAGRINVRILDSRYVHRVVARYILCSVIAVGDVSNVNSCATSTTATTTVSSTHKSNNWD